MPSILNGLFSARAGIEGHGSAISVLADNISNSNTTGYKSSRGDFTSILAGAIGGDVTVGSGSQLSTVTQLFTQGSLEFTGRSLDLAIDGDGFFAVRSTTGARFYARAGNFNVDTDGNLRNQNGFEVLGFPTGGTGSLEALNVNQVSQSNVETENVVITGNVDAASATTAVPPGTPTFSELSNAATFTTFVDMFDSLGAQHTATVFFFHTGAGTWTANAYVDGGEVTGGTAGSPFLVGSTTALNFGANGERTPPVPAIDFTATADWINGAEDAAVNFSFNPFTQFASNSNINSINQDGSGAGNVVSFNIEADGTVFALLDNGQTADLGKIALATFANKEGLARVTGSLWSESVTSGEPVIGTPNTGQFGALQGGALELSNSDIASDFIKLVSLQRGFQSSARIITTIDDLLNEIVNLA